MPSNNFISVPVRDRRTFGEEDQAAIGLEVFGHAFDGVGGIGVDGKRPPVDHDLAVQPARLGRLAGDHEFPIVIETSTDEEPVEPRGVVGNEQHGAGRVQDGFIVAAEAEQEAKDESGNGSHF